MDEGERARDVSWIHRRRRQNELKKLKPKVEFMNLWASIVFCSLAQLLKPADIKKDGQTKSNAKRKLCIIRLKIGES